jgi:hypothetical protein
MVTTEARVFGDEEPVARRRIEPVYGRPGFGHWLALHEGTPAAVATTVATDEDAGPAVLLTGAGALPGRDPSVMEHLLFAVIAAELARRSSALVHVHADPSDDTVLLGRLGFVEVASLQVRSMG